jgi:hypothetical protein
MNLLHHSQAAAKRQELQKRRARDEGSVKRHHLFILINFQRQSHSLVYSLSQCREKKEQRRRQQLPAVEKSH